TSIATAQAIPPWANGGGAGARRGTGAGARAGAVRGAGNGSTRAEPLGLPLASGDRLCPQVTQKIACSGLAVPQWGQRAAVAAVPMRRVGPVAACTTGAAHSIQNCASWGSSALHTLHLMETTPLPENVSPTVYHAARRFTSILLAKSLSE